MAKKWIQKAINPAHRGYCTPMTKKTCTPRRKALARTLKKMARNRKKQEGGEVEYYPTYSEGGWLQGLQSGATAGSAGGAWGTLIGAVAGGVTGAIEEGRIKGGEEPSELAAILMGTPGGSEWATSMYGQQELEKSQALLKRESDDAMLGYKDPNTYWSGYKQLGGMTTPIEVEGNELETTGGVINKNFIGKPTHAQGGFTYPAQPGKTIIPANASNAYEKEDVGTRKLMESAFKWNQYGRERQEEEYCRGGKIRGRRRFQGGGPIGYLENIYDYFMEETPGKKYWRESEEKEKKKATKERKPVTGQYTVLGHPITEEDVERAISGKGMYSFPKNYWRDVAMGPFSTVPDVSMKELPTSELNRYQHATFFDYESPTSMAAKKEIARRRREMFKPQLEQRFAGGGLTRSKGFPIPKKAQQGAYTTPPSVYDSYYGYGEYGAPWSEAGYMPTLTPQLESIPDVERDIPFYWENRYAKPTAKAPEDITSHYTETRTGAGGVPYMPSAPLEEMKTTDPSIIPYSATYGKQPQTGTDWTGVGSKALQYAPAIYDIGRGLLDRPELYDKGEYMTKEKIPYRDVDMRPVISGIESTAATGLKAWRDIGRGRIPYQKGALAITTGTMKAKAEAMMKEQMINIENKYKVDVRNLGVDQANKRLSLAIEDLNRRAKAKGSEYIGKGLEGVSGIAQLSEQTKGLKSKDAMLIDVFCSMYPKECNLAKQSTYYGRE